MATITGQRAAETTRPAVHPSGSWTGCLRAELIRTKNTAIQYFPVIGLALGIISANFSFWASGAHDSSGILSWQAMLVTGMAAPLFALLGGLAETREKKARFGGTHLRPVPAQRVRACRLVVLAGASALFHALNYGSAWLIATAQGRSGASALIAAGVLAWVGSIATVALFGVVARLSGLIASLLMAVAYQAAGTLTAESALYRLIPPAWPVRLLLPTLGIHANAVPLSADDPLASESPFVALVLNIILAAVTVAAYLAVAPTLGRGARPVTADATTKPVTSHHVERFTTDGFTLPSANRRAPREHTTRTCGAALGGVHRVLIRSAVLPLTIAVVALLTAVAIVYPPSYVSGAYTFVLLPLGAGLLPVITWPILASAWRVSVAENFHVRQAFLLWQAVLGTCLGLVAAVAHVAAGGGLVDTARMTVLWVMVGILLATAATALIIRFGVGACVAATVVWTVLSITLGGDVLAHTVLWVVAVPAWPETATTPSRLVGAVIALALGIAAAAWWALAEIRSSERRD